MSPTLRSAQSNSAQGANDEPTACTTPPASRTERQPRTREPVLGRALALVVIAFCAGVVATLAWQSYAGAARELNASSSFRLRWLAPPAAGAVSAVPSRDQEALKAISLDLTGVRQHLDEIATRLIVDHEQMTRDITRRLEAAEKEVLDKIASAPRPTAVPVRSAH